jgi:hypothetical protein
MFIPGIFICSGDDPGDAEGIGMFISIFCWGDACGFGEDEGIRIPDIFISMFDGAVVFGGAVDVVLFCGIVIPGMFCIPGFFAAVDVVLRVPRPRFLLCVADIFMPVMLPMLCFLAVCFFLVVFVVLFLCVCPLLMFIPGIFMSCAATMIEPSTRTNATVPINPVDLVNCMLPPVDK